MSHTWGEWAAKFPDEFPGVGGALAGEKCKCGHSMADHSVCEDVCLHVNESDANGCSCSGFIRVEVAA